MHTRIARMPRMLPALLLCTILAIITIIIVPPAFADEQPSLSSLISEKVTVVVEKAAINDKLDAFADDARAADFYFAQRGSGRCTITSVAMMVRRAAFLDDREDWTAIGIDSVTANGWTSVGVKNSFVTDGYAVDYIDIAGNTEALIALLEEHPEGIAAYDPGVPHAVLLTDYDAETGTFFCADPSSYYAGARMPVADSWNGACRGSQDAVIAGFRKAWVIQR